MCSLYKNKYATKIDIDNAFEISDKALELIKKMIDKGADVNKMTSNKMNVVNWSLHQVELLMGK